MGSVNICTIVLFYFISSEVHILVKDRLLHNFIFVFGGTNLYYHSGQMATNFDILGSKNVLITSTSVIRDSFLLSSVLLELLWIQNSFLSFRILALFFGFELLYLLCIYQK